MEVRATYFSYESSSPSAEATPEPAHARRHSPSVGSRKRRPLAAESQAQNDAGVFEGQIDDDGSSGFGEWGDDADKNNMLIKLNVLSSDSATNVWLVASSTAAKGGNTASQSLTLAGVVAAPNTAALTTPNSHTFLKPATNSAAITVNHPGLEITNGVGVRSAAMGSFFIIGPDIDIIAANEAP